MTSEPGASYLLDKTAEQAIAVRLPDVSGQ